jgi:hypothetical protein
MNKLMTAAQVIGQLEDGMTIGIGGWGPRRKPMALVREILCVSKLVCRFMAKTWMRTLPPMRQGSCGRSPKSCGKVVALLELMRWRKKLLLAEQECELALCQKDAL